MTTPTRGRAALSVLAILLFAGLSLGGNPVSEEYGEIHGGDFVARFQDLAGDDSHTYSRTACQTGRRVVIAGQPFLEITPRLSERNATALIAVTRRDKDDRLEGIADIQTATALDGDQMVYDGTGYYARPLYFAMNGWYAAEIRVFDVSGSATVDLLPARCGVSGAAAD